MDSRKMSHAFVATGGIVVGNGLNRRNCGVRAGIGKIV
jgi:hypothetical protein